MYTTIKKTIVYCCEVCAHKSIRFESEDKNVIKMHEAEHHGLTYDEMEEWERLKIETKKKRLSITCDEEDIYAKIEYILCRNKLREFEKEHNLRASKERNQSMKNTENNQTCPVCGTVNEIKADSIMTTCEHCGQILLCICNNTDEQS